MAGKGTASRPANKGPASAQPGSGGSAVRPGGGGPAGPAEVSRPGTSAAGVSGVRQGRVTDFVRRLNSGQSQRYHSPGKRARTSEGNECSSVSSCEEVSRSKEERHHPGSLITVEIMKDLLREKRKSLRDFIREEISQVADVLHSEIAELRTRVMELEQHAEAQGVVIDDLECRLHQRENRTAELEAALDQVEADQKAGDLILSGTAIPPPPAPTEGREPPEDVTAVTLDVLKRHLPTVELRREDIASCIRVARGKKIICKFFRTGPLTPRYRLYDSRFSLKDSRPEDRLYISENLSKARFDIFQKLLQEKRAKNVHSVFSKNGAVFCRVAMHGRKIRVSHTQQIPEVLRG